MDVLGMIKELQEHHLNIGRRCMSPFSPLSFRTTSVAYLMRLPSCWAMVRGVWMSSMSVFSGVPELRFCLVLSGRLKRLPLFDEGLYEFKV